MKLAPAFEKMINWLNICEEEKKAIRKLGLEVLKEIDKALPIKRNPKQLYAAARHLIGRGKLIRGILVMLINKVYEFRNKQKALKLASAIELLHTASLIHDDIIDGSKTRRGVESVHKKFGLNIAIVSADLLISIAYNLISELGSRIINIISEAGVRMSEGEALEETTNHPSLEKYLDIVDGKSASLIEAACQASAVVSGASEKDVKAFANYGKLVGRTLQIRDDMLDYFEEDVNKGTKRANIVDIFSRNSMLKEAIIKTNELGEEFINRALKEVSFLDEERRKLFEEFAKMILKRPY